jgi:hypothetical protein
MFAGNPCCLLGLRSLARHDAVLLYGYCLRGNAGEMFGEQFSDVFPILIRNQTHRDFRMLCSQ